MSSTSGKVVGRYCVVTARKDWCAWQGSNLRPSDSKFFAPRNSTQ